MAILPFILYFFYQLVIQKKRLCLLGSSVSYAALILTHNCTALIFSGFLFCFLVFISLKRKDWDGFGRSFLAIIWGFGLSAIFWFPALWEKQWVNIHLIYSNAALDFRNNFIELFRLLSSSWTFQGGVGGRHLPFQIGVPHILFGVLSFTYIMKLNSPKGRDTRELWLFFLLLAGLAVFFTNASSAWIWERVPLMKYLQFPWRFLTIVSLMVSILSGGLFCHFNKESGLVKEALQIVLVIIVILSSAQYCKVRGYYVIDEKRLGPTFVREDKGTVSAYNTNEMERVMDFGEYLPKFVKRLPDKNAARKVLTKKGTARIEDLRTWMQGYRFTVIAEQPSEIVVGSFYYPTWKGRLGDNALSLFTDDEGLIHFWVPSGEYSVEIFFGDSGARLWCRFISLFSLATLLVISAWPTGGRFRKRFTYSKKLQAKIP